MGFFCFCFWFFLSEIVNIKIVLLILLKKYFSSWNFEVADFFVVAVVFVVVVVVVIVLINVLNVVVN